MTGVFIQVRLASTRLPGKALANLGGRPVIEHAMASLRRLPASVHALVTDPESAAGLAGPAARCRFELFAGSPDNVLERYVHAARRYGVHEIVRATGDNPLVSWELARMAVAERRRNAADFLAYDGPPLGTGVEVLRTDALERALASNTDPYDREHVSPYLYRNTDRFNCVRLVAPPAYCFPGALVTLDTPADLTWLRTIVESLSDGSPIAVLRLVRWLRGHWSAEGAAGMGRGIHEHAARA